MVVAKKVVFYMVKGMSINTTAPGRKLPGAAVLSNQADYSTMIIFLVPEKSPDSRV
jgi:hypothetical protein